MNLFFIILCLGSQRAENAVISHYYQSTVWLMCLTFERQTDRYISNRSSCQSCNTYSLQTT